jgi:hypothetical protein
VCVIEAQVCFSKRSRGIHTPPLAASQADLIRNPFFRLSRKKVSGFAGTPFLKKRSSRVTTRAKSKKNAGASRRIRGKQIIISLEVIFL